MRWTAPLLLLLALASVRARTEPKRATTSGPTSGRAPLPRFGGPKRTFEVANDTFLLDGEPFRIVSGEYHYQRTHPAHWRDRLRRLSSMGVNSIQTYVLWSLHEPFRPGSYDFGGPRDFEKFLDDAAAEGLWVLLRPGPYVCAEVDAGGLPWWLHDPSVDGAGPEMKPRTSDPRFLKFVDSWWGKLLPMVKPRLAVNGGNVLMVQMENEYGSFNTSCGTDAEGAYLRHLVSTARRHLGPEALFYTTDPPGVAVHGSLPGDEVLTTVDYGPGVDAAWAQSKADELNSPGRRPPINTEFYTGWLTHWGELMANTSTAAMERSLEGILALPNRIVPLLVGRSAEAISATKRRDNVALIRPEVARSPSSPDRRADSTGSVNLYMGAGGTNFGFQAGANLAGRAYEPDLTSYDYDCPIGEDGHVGQRGVGGDGNKYDAVRGALLVAAEADAESARRRLEEALAEEGGEARRGAREVAAASSSPSSSARVERLRRAADEAAAAARFPDLPPPPPVVSYDSVKLSLVGPLLSDAVLSSLAGVGGGGVLLKSNSTTRGSGGGWTNGGIGAVGVPGPRLPAMEELGQASGLVLYRATLPRAALDGGLVASSPSSDSSSDPSSPVARRGSASVLDLGTTVHDFGGVYLDGVPVASLARSQLSTAVALPRLKSTTSGKNDGRKNDGANVTLDILVHEMGRVNFGCVTLDHKGLETDAVTLDGQEGHREGQHRRGEDLRPERHPEEDRGPQLPPPRFPPRRRRVAARDPGQDAGRRPLYGRNRQSAGQSARDEQHRARRRDDGRVREAVREPRRTVSGHGGCDERPGFSRDARGGRLDASAAGRGRARARGAAGAASGRGAGEPLLDWRVIQLPLDDLSKLSKVKGGAAGGKQKSTATSTAAAATRAAETATATAATPPTTTSAHSGAAASLSSRRAAAALAASSGGMKAPLVFRGTLFVPSAKDASKKPSTSTSAGGDASPLARTDDQGHPASTWVDMSGWGKGLLYVNGFNLGYYWPSKGPQTRQYLPGPVLKPGKNDVVLIELEAGSGPDATVSFASEPDFRGRVAPASGVV